MNIFDNIAANLSLKYENSEFYKNKLIKRYKPLITPGVKSQEELIISLEKHFDLELTDKAELTEENNILEGIIRFGGETAKEVMTSRLDVVDLDIRTPFKDVIQCIIDNAYSRIPRICCPTLIRVTISVGSH